ncbi:MAG: Transposase [Myxococcaceae bacterium]|nr:Transposase [Myxococcaceae bacterium]
MADGHPPATAHIAGAGGASKEENRGAIRDRPFGRTRSEAAARDESCSRRLGVYTEVRRGRALGESVLGISRALRLARGTVRKYAYGRRFPSARPAPTAASRCSFARGRRG